MLRLIRFFLILCLFDCAGVSQVHAAADGAKTVFRTGAFKPCVIKRGPKRIPAPTSVGQVIPLSHEIPVTVLAIDSEKPVVTLSPVSAASLTDQEKLEAAHEIIDGVKVLFPMVHAMACDALRLDAGAMSDQDRLGLSFLFCKVGLADLLESQEKCLESQEEWLREKKVRGIYLLHNLILSFKDGRLKSEELLSTDEKYYLPGLQELARQRFKSAHFLSDSYGKYKRELHKLRSHLGVKKS